MNSLLRCKWIDQIHRDRSIKVETARRIRPFSTTILLCVFVYRKDTFKFYSRVFLGCSSEQLLFSEVHEAPRNRYTTLQWPWHQRRFPSTLRGGSTVVTIRRFRFLLLWLLFFFYFFPTVSCRPPASSIEDRVFMYMDDLSPLTTDTCFYAVLNGSVWERKKGTSNTLTDEAAERNIGIYS